MRPMATSRKAKLNGHPFKLKSFNCEAHVIEASSLLAIWSRWKFLSLPKLSILNYDQWHNVRLPTFEHLYVGLIIKWLCVPAQSMHLLSPIAWSRASPRASSRVSLRASPKTWHSSSCRTIQLECNNWKKKVTKYRFNQVLSGYLTWLIARFSITMPAFQTYLTDRVFAGNDEHCWSDITDFVRFGYYIHYGIVQFKFDTTS